MKKIHWVLLAAAMLILVTLACGPSDVTPTQEPQPTEEQAPTEAVEPTRPEPTPEPTSTPVPKTEATDGGLEIVNQSGADIWYVYLSPSKADEWGEDWLGDDIVRDGETYVLEGVPDGIYDLRAEDTDGEAIEVVWELDLDEIASLIITGAAPAGGKASLEVVNESGTVITYLYISPTDSASWGEDVLGADLIEAQGSYVLDGIPPGSYDIQAADDSDAVIESVFNVDLSGQRTWTVAGKADLPNNAVLRFEDDFSDNRNDWGLDTEDDEVHYMRPSGGEYCILIKRNQFTAWEWYEPFRTDEFVAEAACTLSGAADASCGLGFGPDGDNLYWFEISPFDQTYALFLLENDSWQENLIDWTLSKNIDPSRSNYLSMERVNGVVSLYVNGVLLDRIESQRFPTGRIGIGGSTYEEPNGTVCLDDLRVWRLE
jgi:hypothetical protein